MLAKRGGSGRRRRSRPGVDRRWKKRDHIPWLAGICILAYIIIHPRYGLWLVILLDVVFIVIWILFLMPTKCDFEVDGRGCRRDVYGKVNGCNYHGRDKRDTIYGLLGVMNPGVLFRLTWLDGAQAGRRIGTNRRPPPSNPADDARNRSQAIFNALSLFVAAVGSLASVLALFH